MARLNLCVNWDDFQLGVDAWKTVASVKAPANQMVAVKGFWVCGNGVAGDAEHLKVRLRRVVADSGTGTTFVPVKTNNVMTATAQCTARVKFTVEPTDSGTDQSIYPHKTHPQGSSTKDCTFEDAVIKEGTELALQVKVPSGGVAVYTDGHLNIEE